jgi:hypothetical protein
MNKVVKIALWGVVIGSLSFAVMKAYKLYKARQAAKTS